MSTRMPSISNDSLSDLMRTTMGDLPAAFLPLNRNISVSYHQDSLEQYNAELDELAADSPCAEGAALSELWIPPHADEPDRPSEPRGPSYYYITAEVRPPMPGYDDGYGFSHVQSSVCIEEGLSDEVVAERWHEAYCGMAAITPSDSTISNFRVSDAYCRNFVEWGRWERDAMLGHLRASRRHGVIIYDEYAATDQITDEQLAECEPPLYRRADGIVDVDPRPTEDKDGQLLFFPKAHVPKAPSRKTRSRSLSPVH